MAKVCEVIDLAPLNEKAQGDVFSVPMVPSQIARTFGGQVVQFVPKCAPGIAWVVSPFMAMFAYWSAAFVDVPGAD